MAALDVEHARVVAGAVIFIAIFVAALIAEWVPARVRHAAVI